MIEFTYIAIRTIACIAAICIFSSTAIVIVVGYLKHLYTQFTNTTNT